VFLRHQSFKLNQQPVTRRCASATTQIRAASSVQAVEAVEAYAGWPRDAARECVGVRARRNIGRAHCDESVLIITLVRGTSRDAFADTYDKLSVYQQISFPNPAIFPLVYPRPLGEHRALRRARPTSRYSLPFTCTHVCISGRSARLSRAQECDDSGRESVFTQ